MSVVGMCIDTLLRFLKKGFLSIYTAPSFLQLDADFS